MRTQTNNRTRARARSRKTFTVSDADFVRDVRFSRIGNGPALRVGRLMQSIGAEIGTVGQAYRVKGGFFVAIAPKRHRDATAALPAPSFTALNFDEFMGAIAKGGKLPVIPLTPVRRERP